MRTVTVLLVLLAVTAPALAGPDLVLEVGTGAAEAAFDSEVEIVVRFVNRGDESVSYWEGEYATFQPFPDVRLIAEESGIVYRAHNSSFQSMWEPGMVGAVIRLGPGESREHRYARSRFVAEEGGRWGQPVALPAGDYRVEGVYMKKSRLVSWRAEAFEIEEREAPGIFTGMLWAAPARLTVRPPVRPRVVLTAPDEAAAVLRLTFTNPTAKEVVFAGLPKLSLSSKMYGNAVAADQEEFRLPVPAGRTIRHDLPLRAMDWEVTRRGATERVGLADVVPQGLTWFRFELFGPEGAALWQTDGIFATVPPVPERGGAGLRVEATLPFDTVAAGEPVPLTIRLRNLGKETLRLPRELCFPEQVMVVVEDAEGIRASRGSVTRTASGSLFGDPGGAAGPLAEGLSWDGDRFEEASALDPAGLAELAPGNELVRVIDLQAALAGRGFTPGHYRIRVAWQNGEPGTRLGIEPPLPTGQCWSAWIPLTVE